jgi:hypothetical protein
MEGVTLCSIGEDPLQERPNTAPRGKLIDGKYEDQCFYVRSDRIKELVAVSFPFVLSVGTGALTSGWIIKIANDDPSKYAFARFGGYMTVEKSNVEAYPRPTQPVQLYEFEGCPFCRKVRAGRNSFLGKEKKQKHLGKEKKQKHVIPVRNNIPGPFGCIVRRKV